MQSTTLEIRQVVDIWSLGCVFSEAAVWVVYGHAGLLQYRQRRKNEVANRLGPEAGFCFHNGTDVLKSVEAMHVNVLKVIRASDRITGATLQMVEDMLVEACYRSTAVQLLGKRIKILAESRDKSAMNTPPTSPMALQQPPELPPSDFPPVRSKSSIRWSTYATQEKSAHTRSSAIQALDTNLEGSSNGQQRCFNYLPQLNHLVYLT